MRVVVLVDGEHYPPVVREAIGVLTDEGDEVVAAVFCGGTEKIGEEDLAEVYGVPVERGADREKVLAAAIDTYRAEAVVDLSGHPVVTSTDRFRLATVALGAGAIYRGADFELRPVPFADVLTKPAIRVIATGKRTGKTAVAGALARHAVRSGYNPVVVAMGRGGPALPEVVEVTDDLTPEGLLALADAGKHAASDYIEDALTSRVPTIGCRRVGGGLAGAPYLSNVVEGARIAEDRPENLVILEGSGAAVPPVRADAGLLCVPATGDPADVTGYLVPYRVLLADLAVVTMAEQVTRAAEVEAAIRTVAPGIDVVRTVFRPSPLAPVSGRRVFFCTTAPPQVAETLTQHLETHHGCEVVGYSHNLADRRTLASELDASRYDVLLTELKAGAVDVAVRKALADEREIVFCDNEVIGEGVDEAFDRLIEIAEKGRSR